MIKIFVTLFSILLFVQSCGYKRKLIDYTKYSNQIDKKYYKLSSQKFVYDPIIDTLSVYTSSRVLTFDGKPEVYETFGFIRFSAQGVMFISNILLTPPSSLEFNGMNQGQYCFYRIENRKITVELFDYRLRLFRYWYGTVYQDRIVFTDYKLRTLGGAKGSLNNDTFTKQHIESKSKVEFPR